MSTPAVTPDPIRNEPAAIETGLNTLFQWAAALRPGQLPPPVKQRAAGILFDDIAAMTAAWREPEFRRLYPRLMAQNRAAESTIFCQPGVKADRSTAALVNATAANWLELDEGYRNAPCHAGLYTLPALLALAEADDAPFEHVLHHLAVTYEIITRIARAFPQRRTVMQSHGRYAALAAAITTALHHGYDAQLLAHAACAAVTLITPAPRSHLAGGALVRNVWAGVGARNGMDAADWARAGISGTPYSIYDVYSVVLNSDCKPEALIEGLGDDWAVMSGYTKMYACCQHLHAAVEATLDMRAEILGRKPDDIAAIHVETHALALPLDQRRPHTSLAAKFSMSHAMAAAVLLGKADESAFNSDIIHDADIDALRQRVSMAPWSGNIPPAPNDRPARVQIRYKDGTVVASECLSARGGADRPFPQADVLAKIERLAGTSYPGLPRIAAQYMSCATADHALPWRQVLAAMRGATPQATT